MTVADAPPTLETVLHWADRRSNVTRKLAGRLRARESELAALERELRALHAAAMAPSTPAQRDEQLRRRLAEAELTAFRQRTTR